MSFLEYLTIWWRDSRYGCRQFRAAPVTAIISLEWRNYRFLLFLALASFLHAQQGERAMPTNRISPNVASSCSQNQPVSDPDFSSIASVMQERVAGGVPSIAIAVAHHGRIVWECAVGMSDI